MSSPSFDPSSLDRTTVHTLPDGRSVTIHQPGANAVPPSADWRFNESAYRRYAPYLETAATNWPAETKFSCPPGMSPNTFVARMRDARQALLKHSYDPALAAKFVSIGDAAVIALDSASGDIWFRARGQPGRPKREFKTEVTAINRPLHDPSKVLPLPDEPSLRAMCQLLSSRTLSGPFLIRGRIDAALLSTLETTYDIAFAYDSLTDITTIL